jgi:hypothetical protein
MTDEPDFRADPSVVVNPARIIKQGGDKVIKDDKPDKPEKHVKVKVSDRWAVVHDGNRYVKGDMLTVPEHVAEEWERNRWVERVSTKSEARARHPNESATESS